MPDLPLDIFIRQHEYSLGVIPKGINLTLPYVYSKLSKSNLT